MQYISIYRKVQEDFRSLFGISKKTHYWFRFKKSFAKSQKKLKALSTESYAYLRRKPHKLMTTKEFVI